VNFSLNEKKNYSEAEILVYIFLTLINYFNYSMASVIFQEEDYMNLNQFDLGYLVGKDELEIREIDLFTAILKYKKASSELIFLFSPPYFNDLMCNYYLDGLS